MGALVVVVVVLELLLLLLLCGGAVADYAPCACASLRVSCVVCCVLICRGVFGCVHIVDDDGDDDTTPKRRAFYIYGNVWDKLDLRVFVAQLLGY